MKNLKTFNEFVNESTINEGAMAKRLAKVLSDYNAENYIEEKSDSPELVAEMEAICKILGQSPANVFGIDEYTEHPAAERAYGLLQSGGYDSIDDNRFSGDSEIGYDKKMGVIQCVDMTDQFTLYWFTANSNF
jgi:hypothetical protein